MPKVTISLPGEPQEGQKVTLPSKISIVCRSTPPTIPHMSVNVVQLFLILWEIGTRQPSRQCVYLVGITEGGTYFVCSKNKHIFIQVDDFVI